jgi:hypothetical protein
MAFVMLMLDKWAKLNDAAGPKGTVFPDRMRFSSKPLTRRSDFAVSFRITACLDDVLKKGGLWDPLPTSWSAWSLSMQDAWSQRGAANLAYNPTSDAIIDLCTSDSIPAHADNGGSSDPKADVSKKFTLQNIAKERSWLAYENSLSVDRTQNKTNHKVSDGYVPAALSALAGSGLLGSAGSKLSSVISAGQPKKDVTQYQAAPTEYILMQGKAMRIAHIPAVPSLVSIGGKAVEVVKETIDGPKTVACFLDTPVYLVRWAILYRLKDGYMTSDIPVKRNLALCCDPNTGADS